MAFLYASRLQLGNVFRVLHGNYKSVSCCCVLGQYFHHVVKIPNQSFDFHTSSGFASQTIEPSTEKLKKEQKRGNIIKEMNAEKSRMNSLKQPMKSRQEDVRSLVNLVASFEKLEGSGKSINSNTLGKELEENSFEITDSFTVSETEAATDHKLKNVVKFKVKIAKLTFDQLLRAGRNASPEERQWATSYVLERMAHLWSTDKVSETQLIMALKDPYLVELCSDLCHMRPSPLFRSLKALTKLCKRESDIPELLKTKLNGIDLKALNMKDLMVIAIIHQDHQSVAYQVALYKEALNILMQAFNGCNDPQAILRMWKHVRTVKVSQFQSPSTTQVIRMLMSLLSKRSQKLVAYMSHKHLCELLWVMAVLKHRDMKLLRTISYRLCQFEAPIPLDDAVKIIRSCSVLQYNHPALLEKISNELALRLHAEPFNTELVQTAVMVLQLYHSLHLLHPAVLKTLTEILLKDISIPLPHDLVFLVRFCGILHFMPDCLQKNLHTVLDCIQRSAVGSEGSIAWLDTVWSLTQHGLVTGELINSVLNGEALNILESSNNLSFINRRQLLHLDTTARLEIADYSGARLPARFIEEEKQKVSGGAYHSRLSVRNLQRKVHEALLTIVPSPNYIQENSVTPHGYHMFLETLVNDEGHFQPMPPGDAVNSTTPACHRLAFQVLDFKDMTVGVVQPLGYYYMESRLLQRQGYTVIVLSQKELEKYNNADELSKHLKVQISEALDMTKRSRTEDGCPLTS